MKPHFCVIVALVIFSTMIRTTMSVGVLKYLHDDLQNVSDFQVEVQAVPGYDPPGTYYVGIQFNLYDKLMPCYLGMSILSVDSLPKRLIVFSCWHHGDLYPSSVVKTGENVVANNFTHEGNGVHTHWKYEWQSGVPQNFLVTGAENTNKKGYAIFSAYIRINGYWRFLASITKYSIYKDGNFYLIRGNTLTAFIENFNRTTQSYYLKRKGLYTCQFFVQTGKKRWQEITKAVRIYTVDQEKQEYGTIQQMGDSAFAMQIDGHTPNPTPYGTLLERNPCPHDPY